MSESEDPIRKPRDVDPFRLDDIFTDAGSIFAPNKVAPASNSDVILAVDTNVLLLPYTLRKDRLPKLQMLYSDLKAEGRLFLPAQAAREFIVHRDRKLAELLKTISDMKSRVFIGESMISPILSGIEGSERMFVANETLAEAKKDYIAAIDVIEHEVRSWAGDDPVTQVYKSVFDEKNIVSPKEDRAELLAEWEHRSAERIPPGYKDSGKDDSGIGDFLIWKSLLEIGAAQKRDLIFLTNDEKGDWYIRVNGGGAYPRPEPVAEYRRHSGGRSLRLSSLHDVMRELDASPEFVDEIENAELDLMRSDAGNADPDVREGSLQNLAIGTTRNASRADFLLRYGGGAVSFRSKTANFRFEISERSSDSVWIYPNKFYEFFKVPTGNIGDQISEKSLIEVHMPFEISKGQLAIVRDSDGNSMIARLLANNAPKKDERFSTSFMFCFYGPNDEISVV